MQNTKGFTLAEVIIAASIMVVLSIAVANFAKESADLNRRALNRINNNFEVGRALKTFVTELRSATTLVATSTSEVVFLADLNNDGASETIRYFLDNTEGSFKRVAASGTTTLITGIQNSSSTPMLSYSPGLVVISIRAGERDHATSVVLRNLLP